MWRSSERMGEAWDAPTFMGGGNFEKEGAARQEREDQHLSLDKPEISKNSEKVCKRREQAQKLGCFMSWELGESCDMI